MKLTASSRVSSHQRTPGSAFSGCWFISWHLCAFEHTYLCDCCTETGICCVQKWFKGNSRFKRWCVWLMCLLIQPDSGLCVFECACRMLQRSTVPSSVRCSRSFTAIRPSNVLTGRAFTTPCRTAIGWKGVSNLLYCICTHLPINLLILLLPRGWTIKILITVFRIWVKHN